MSTKDVLSNIDDTPVDDDAPGPPISVPDSGDTGEGGKLKMIIQLLKKCLGVKDIAAMRLSLPASLLEPIPNLEYWQYLDRPDFFASITDYDDPFDRILSVVRFTLTKDLKFVHGRIFKPYNSVLGEHFRAHWDVPPLSRSSDLDMPPIPATHFIPDRSTQPDITPVQSSIHTSETASIKSGRSSKSIRSGISSFKAPKSPSTAATSPQQFPETNMAAQMSNLSLDAVDDDTDADGRIRVVYLTEQISHHPPFSAFYARCPARNLEMYGVDQLSAKVAGTTVKVLPGPHNKGIFVKITGGPGEGEQYRITHPVASVNGILRGNFYATVSESTIITCTGGKHGEKYRAIIEYKEESWLGKPHFLLEGVIHTVSEGENCDDWTKVKHVPKHHVIAVFEGSWRGLVKWKRLAYAAANMSVASSPNPSHVRLPVPSLPAGAASKADLIHSCDNEWVTLLDLSKLQVIPKSVRPLEKQIPYESRKLWEKVTSHLLKKEFSDATREKVAIEQKQREIAAERKRQGVQFVPKYFEWSLEKGFCLLTEEGQKAIEEELKQPSS